MKSFVILRSPVRSWLGPKYQGPIAQLGERKTEVFGISPIRQHRLVRSRPGVLRTSPLMRAWVRIPLLPFLIYHICAVSNPNQLCNHSIKNAQKQTYEVLGEKR
ncbi:hypothetical protein ATCV1_Z256R [Acanthocystis turfacea chlorella virus 1]|uniref:Uncharacterized protein Z256R n=1 Tax=Chlorovirus heliozoae TaxID=322019 RepID=A7K8L6_9PHYC|nr:hypothetical protein ATCV1_Z256R [Acanthocystis turfacea chlorella virus 1]ABT16390.1 hypothetical protein ATCV1_Z256R [Acanthocystis turfacea chlorella virus 1]